MIKGIIFDCFGVLTGDLWKEFVASLPLAQQEPARELNRALDRGLLSLKDFSREIHELTGGMPEQVESVINAEMTKNKPLLKYIAELHGNYKLALLSNISTNWVRDVFLTSQEQELFDTIVLSYEVGMVKPDERIYELTAERLGLGLDECVFIDDGVVNCRAAETVGMKAVLYENFPQMKTELSALLKA